MFDEDRVSVLHHEKSLERWMVVMPQLIYTETRLVAARSGVGVVKRAKVVERCKLPNFHLQTK